MESKEEEGAPAHAPVKDPKNDAAVLTVGGAIALLVTLLPSLKDSGGFSLLPALIFFGVILTFISVGLTQIAKNKWLRPLATFALLAIIVLVISVFVQDKPMTWDKLVGRLSSKPDGVVDNFAWQSDQLQIPLQFLGSIQAKQYAEANSQVANGKDKYITPSESSFAIDRTSCRDLIKDVDRQVLLLTTIEARFKRKDPTLISAQGELSLPNKIVSLYNYLGHHTYVKAVASVEDRVPLDTDAIFAQALSYYQKADEYARKIEDDHASEILAWSEDQIKQGKQRLEAQAHDANVEWGIAACRAHLAEHDPAQAELARQALRALITVNATFGSTPPINWTPDCYDRALDTLWRKTYRPQRK